MHYAVNMRHLTGGGENEDFSFFIIKKKREGKKRAKHTNTHSDYDDGSRDQRPVLEAFIVLSCVVVGRRFEN